MQYHSLVIPLGVMALSLTACSDEWESAAETEQSSGVVSYPSERMSVKLKASIIKDIDNGQRSVSVPTGSLELDDFLNSIGVTSISRIFPPAGRDEPRQRAEGLHLWYTISMPAEGGETRGAEGSDLSSIVSYAEPINPSKLERTQFVEIDEPVRTRSGMGSTQLFDDPLYVRQWNLKNRGDVGNYADGDGKAVVSSIAGADINVEAAWQITTGDPGVVVAVVDGGIDVTHPDLIESLWVNEGEIPGNGIDDDNNGYVDDYYGYNFTEDTCLITPTRHGTHVAGVIAARNNNDRGVCSIAGGNGKSSTGVRVMSCQIFRNNPDYDPSDPESSETIGSGDRYMDAAAIVYGANNGAVISQNSWGFGFDATPLVIREAIDYFNKYAGGSRTARPLVQGGVVIFAAGNDGTHYPCWPASEPNVISVAAWNPDYQASWYTNYGETVDIAAPGGSQPERGLYPYEDGFPTSAVLSTVPYQEDGHGGYAYMQGTSMACPHVSGIAALIVSRYGSAGFTADELRQRIVTGVKPIDYNAYVMDYYFDGLGMGYADAACALSNYDRNVQPSAPVFDLERVVSGYGSTTLAWHSDNKGSDGSLQNYRLYISSNPITTDNYAFASSHLINANYAEPGQVFERINNRLPADRTYYYAVQAVARNGQASPVAILEGGITTLHNEAPVISCDMVGNRITMAGRDSRDVHFTITDAENHDWTYKFVNSSFTQHRRDGNVISLHIDAYRYAPGVYRSELVVTDEYDAATEFEIILDIQPDQAPELKTALPTLNVRRGEARTWDLVNFISDEDPSSVTYSVSYGEGITAGICQGQLCIQAKDWGESYVEVVATDSHHLSGTFRLPVFVYDNEGIYALYPTVATSALYIRVGEVVNGPVQISIRNAAGREVMQRSFDTVHLNPERRTYMVMVSSLAPGNYTLTLSNQGNVYQEKFIKQ